MGLYHTVWFTYGLEIEGREWSEHWEEHEEALEEIEGVHLFTMGACGPARYFLVTQQQEIEPEQCKFHTPKVDAEMWWGWDQALMNAAAHLGVSTASDPGYIILHDYS